MGWTIHQTIRLYCDEPGCDQELHLDAKGGTDARFQARYLGWEYYKYSDHCPEHLKREPYIEPWASVWRRREAARGGEHGNE